MLIKVIGCDASGKTTFIKALSKELGYPVKKGSSFESALCSQDELFEKFKQNQELENTILDRDFYCNLSYAPLYKDYAMISDDQFKWLEFIADPKSLLIYLYADAKTLQKRLNERGDDYVKAERIPEILASYENVLSKSKVNYVQFDTSDIDTEEMVKLTKKVLAIVDKK